MPATSTALRRLRRGFRRWCTYARDLVWMAVDTLVVVTVHPRKTSTFLTLRLDAIGDFFIWLQSGAQQLANYARQDGHRSVLVANGAWSSYAMELGMWDEVIAVDVQRFMRNLRYRIAVLKRLRAVGAATLIQPRTARVLLQEDAVARISGASYRIGNDGISSNQSGWQRRLGRRYYEKKVDTRDISLIHELERNARFVLDVVGEPATRFLPFGPRPQPEVGTTIVIALGASWIGRVWPVSSFARAMRLVRNRFPAANWTLLGGPADAALARELIQLLDFSVYDRVGKTSLSEYVGAISEATLVLCNESSALHIAAAVGRPAVCVLGGGHFGRFAPYPDQAALRIRTVFQPMACFRCDWNCRYPRAEDEAVRCIREIAADPVAKAMIGLLDECG